MPVIRIALLVVFALSATPASADSVCWTSSRLSFAFGSVTAGQSASAITPLSLQCNNHDPNEAWVRICMNLSKSGMPEMDTNAPDTPLYYAIYAENNPSTALTGGSTGASDVALPLKASSENQIFPFHLLAKIVPGQRSLQAGNYFDYDATAIVFHYAYSRTKQGLPSCSSMIGQSWTTTVHSEATIKNGCELISVDPMSFGAKSPVGHPLLEGSARARVEVRCPLHTSFTVSMDRGQHSLGGSRRMCSGSACVTYDLFQDEGHAIPWDDGANRVTEVSTGVNQSINVYGNIPAQRWPAAGDYTDSVVVTLSY
ncbi:hypothetical protein ABW09_19065 [Pluralibacter gergoviae]|uniref:Csu type fimbrial protein n=1 Tax=Pluralibacter gergoviae TaxID=61647 RepID=UPI0006519997|nr:spore coat U domain-containing protein [Pluralibacter gergoviae]KMK16872.1 hypothetical protein ABW09_19065 [Pluralibacter gergoviae]